MQKGEGGKRQRGRRGGREGERAALGTSEKSYSKNLRLFSVLRTENSETLAVSLLGWIVLVTEDVRPFILDYRSKRNHALQLGKK